MALRITAGVLGLFFLLQALSWVVAPQTAVEGLGMTLLEGVGRSTQIGDIGGFFVALSTMILLGAARSNAHWLRAAAILLGSAAGMRTIAWLAHGADLATMFIVIEIATSSLLLFVSTRLEPANADPSS